MTYHVLNTYDMLKSTDESTVQKLLSSFSCPLNSEIESYAHNQALLFTQKGISITYLVFAIEEDISSLVGFYTIAYKVVEIPKTSISRTTERKLARFGEYNPANATYTIPAPLIAQFGKNYSNGLNSKITGKQLMDLAIDQIESITALAGGRMCYLECEDRPKLIAFYQAQGFQEFAIRYTHDENDSFYHQMMRILK